MSAVLAEEETGIFRDPIAADLRLNALKMNPAEIGLVPGQYNKVWGVLMEWLVDSTAVTLLCLADRTVSFYMSNGSAVIGAGSHESVINASNKLLALSNDYIDSASLVQTFPDPSKIECVFYFRVNQGTYRIAEIEEDLKNHHSPYSQLFWQGHEVIAQIRNVEEKITAFLQFAAAGKIENMKKLMESGIFINAKDRTGHTALMAACLWGKDDIVKFLLDSNAEVELKDQYGYTALMCACNKGKTECVKLLIKHGAYVDAQDNDGASPLMYAAQGGYNDIIRLLLQSHADRSLKADNGFTALDFARQNGHKKSQELLTLHR